MSLRLFLGWVLAILGLLVILALFGLDFGVHGPFGAPIANAAVGLILVAVGVSLASGRGPLGA